MTKKAIEEEAKSALEAVAETVKTPEDAQKIVERDGEKAKHKGLKGALKKHYEDLCDVLAMLKDSATLRYTKKIPLATLAAIAGAVAYIVLPIDIIPDFIPALGLVDDAAVLALALRIAQSDLSAWREWKKAKTAQETVTQQ